MQYNRSSYELFAKFKDAINVELCAMLLSVVQ